MNDLRTCKSIIEPRRMKINQCWIRVKIEKRYVIMSRNIFQARLSISAFPCANYYIGGKNR